MNAGPRLLARGIEGAAWVTLPSALEAKKACVKIRNEDKRCLIYSLCAFMLDKQGSFPDHPDRVSNYQVGNILKRGKRSNSVTVPNNVGLDFTAIDLPRVDVADQLLAFEETNDLGVYIYQREEKNYGHGRTLGMPRLCRTPSRLHKLECILLLHKNHYVYVRHFQRVMSCTSEHVLKTTRMTHSVK